MGIVSIFWLISVLIGVALVVCGLVLFGMGRETRRIGLVVGFLGIALQFWWVFFIGMLFYKSVILKQDI